MRPAVRRVVVKVGSSVLTDGAGRLVPGRIEALAEQVAAGTSLEADPLQPILVSSGAIACGMAQLSVAKRPRALAQLQACAAIGQSELMHRYAQAFGRHGLVVAQVLLTQEDLAETTRYRNAKQTFLTLLHRRAVPIVNENDTVAVEEITFGDNDRLAALVAVAVDAHLLVLLSDVDGLVQDGHLIERLDALKPVAAATPQAARRQTTKGGMTSKLEAARIAGHQGIPMVIANGLRPRVLTDLLAGQPVGTMFVPPGERLSRRKWWMAFSLRAPKGELVVDGGAAQALLERGKSLLASGILDVKGPFEAGVCVSIRDASGTELARGVCSFSSAEVARIRGLKSQDAARTLGHPTAREVVHRDHMVLAREVAA